MTPKSFPALIGWYIGYLRYFQISIDTLREEDVPKKLMLKELNKLHKEMEEAIKEGNKHFDNIIKSK